MATSAFKSTSRRPSTSSSTATTTTTDRQPLQQSRKQQNSTQKVPTRRSRSVSAFSRTHLDTTTEFQNKRDNPLFWDAGSSHFEEDNDVIKLSKFEISKFGESNNTKDSSDGGVESRRGRSISRNSEGKRIFSGGAGERTHFGRSLSSVTTARRRRSPFRGHYGNSESEKEQENEFSNFRGKSMISSNANPTLLEGKSKLVRSASDLSEIMRSSYTWSSQHPAFETSDDSTTNLSGSRIPHWDDGISTSSISEAEERTIMPISEQKISPLKENNGTTSGILETVRSEVRQAISDMQNDLKIAMLRSSSDVIHGGIVADLAPQMEITNTVGLVRDFREEFARELEECEERTRKLRAELAVEEHREIELNNILNDFVPEPKTPLVEKPRAVRKDSFERKKMSKRLEQEALAYFDECVSISTFEDSDFSSLEDLPSSMVSVDGPGGERLGLSFPGVPSRASGACSFSTQDDLQTTAVVHCNEGRNLSANHSSCNNTSEANSLTPSSSDTTSLQEDIRNYVKLFSKDNGRGRNESNIARISHQNARDYNCEVPMEKLLLDRVTFRSSIEFGSMILCGGGSVGLSVPPFTSVLW